MEWASLHSHTTFSFMDGFASPAAHIERAAELGMNALALTEHGNVSSHVRLEKAAQAAGIKPVFGLEAYTGPVTEEERSKFKWHLTVLAENGTGYRNLLRITTEAWSEGFYHEPTVGGESIAEHADGLFILSGCTGSKLATDLLGGKGRPEHRAYLRAGENTAAQFRDCFGDHYFLEVQPFPELDRCRALNQALERIGHRLRIPLVATADVHYPHAADNEMQLILHAAGRGGHTAEKQAQNWEYSVKLTYPESDRALWRRLVQTGLTREAAKQAVLNAGAIAERCTVELPKARRLRYPLRDGEKAEQVLWDWLITGMSDRGLRRGDEERTAYLDRLVTEYELIKSKDLADFFLATADVVSWAKDQGIAVGPARGSAAASLACYLLRITEIDPLKYPAMLLERFLDPGRADMPDIDLDFESARRDEVRRYLERKWGQANVGNIAGFTRYRGKLALNDVARTLSIPKSETAPVAELVAVRPDGDAREDMSLADAAEFPAARAVFDRHPELRTALRLEGNLRGLTVHAAGLVVASEPLSNFVASYTRSSGTGTGKRELRVISADMKDVEYLNALKMDFLGLTTMDVLAGALRLAGLPLSALSEIPDDDPEVMAAFAAADTVGIFQFDGRATRNVCRAVRPQTFMELSDINALSRPGCMASGTTEAYIKCSRGERGDLHETVRDILGPTRGQLVYQEQLLNVLRSAGGFGWDRASKVRKIISKKIGGGALQGHRDGFLDGCQANGLPVTVANHLWHSMESSASYLFNTAHAVSYAKLALWCMWLKVHHPGAFYCSALRRTPNDKQHEKALRTMLLDAEAHGVKIDAPELARSGTTWEPMYDAEGSVLLAGFSQIPGVGEKTAEDIITERNSRNFQNWDGLLAVKGIGPASLAKIKTFAESADPFGVHRAERVVAEITHLARSGKIAVPVPTITSADLLGRRVRAKQRVVWAGLIRAREYHDALEDERERTGDGPDEIRARLKSPNLLKYAVLKCYDHMTDEEVFVRVSRYDFPRIGRQIAAAEPGKDALVVQGMASTSGLGAAIRADKIWVLEP